MLHENRAKRKDNGEWVKGFIFKLSQNDGMGYSWCIAYEPLGINNHGQITGCCEIDPKTIGIHAGIITKDKEPIYTGDIVSAYSEVTNKEEAYIVEYSNEKNAIVFKYADKRHEYAYTLDELIEKELGDVIEFEKRGNIYDNPDMIKNLMNAYYQHHQHKTDKEGIER